MLGIINFHAWSDQFPCWERHIPSMGTFHSQHGNMSLPAWEYVIPSMEIDGVAHVMRCSQISADIQPINFFT